MSFKSCSYLFYSLFLFTIPSALADATQPMPALAKQGNAKAQYEWGMKLIEGNNIQQDTITGRRWIEKAAKQGYTDAETQLGQMYISGEGIPADISYEASHDYKSARKWLKKAAAKGDKKAYYFLGSLYEEGKGVKHNSIRAFEYYQKAAILGESEAQNLIGNFYYSGKKPTERDYTAAKAWFEKSAAQNNASAKSKLAGMYRLGLGVPVDIKKSLSMYKQLCKDGQQTACFAAKEIEEKSK